MTAEAPIPDEVEQTFAKLRENARRFPDEREVPALIITDTREGRKEQHILFGLNAAVLWMVSIASQGRPIEGPKMADILNKKQHNIQQSIDRIRYRMGDLIEIIGLNLGRTGGFYRRPQEGVTIGKLSWHTPGESVTIQGAQGPAEVRVKKPKW